MFVFKICACIAIQLSRLMCRAKKEGQIELTRYSHSDYNTYKYEHQSNVMDDRHKDILFISVVQCNATFWLFAQPSMLLREGFLASHVPLAEPVVFQRGSRSNSRDRKRPSRWDSWSCRSKSCRCGWSWRRVSWGHWRAWQTQACSHCCTGRTLIVETPAVWSDASRNIPAQAWIVAQV